MKSELGLRTLLSTLWIVIMLNMIFIDIFALYIPGFEEELAGFAGDMPIPLLMLGAAVMVEIPILMILASRLLPAMLNRWANVGAGLLMILFVVGPEIGNSAVKPHYLFMGAIEVTCMIAIIVLALRFGRDDSWRFVAR